MFTYIPGLQIRSPEHCKGKEIHMTLHTEESVTFSKTEPQKIVLHRQDPFGHSEKESTQAALHSEKHKASVQVHHLDGGMSAPLCLSFLHIPLGGLWGCHSQSESEFSP